jgi:hypothetical protein
MVLIPGGKQESGLEILGEGAKVREEVCNAEDDER